MTDWRADCDVDTARQRAAMLANAREQFVARDVLEVQTPLLSEAAVTDLHIESIGAEATVMGRPMYLHTSPEYAMKRLIASGFPDCFQICPVFRDGECGRRHQPEFSMLEWYRLGFGLQAIIDDTTSLLQALFAGSNADRATRNTPVQLRYDDALRAACGLDSESPVAALSDAVGEQFPASLHADRDAMLDYLFDDRVARRMTAGALHVITHYPATQAALAQIDASSDRALRFEVYYAGVELANGFVELQDATEQRRRFAAEQERRKRSGMACRPIDEKFLAALEHGLPACAGVAVGFDRLVMLASGKQSLQEVLSFAHTIGS